MKAAKAEAVGRLHQAQAQYERRSITDRIRHREAVAREPLGWRARHAPGLTKVTCDPSEAPVVRVQQSVEVLAEKEQRTRKRRGPTRDVVAMLEVRGVLGLVHVLAANTLLDDAETAAGVRQPRKTPKTGTGTDFCALDVQMAASTRLRQAKAAIETAGPLAWPAVEAVVIRSRTISDLAGSRRSRDGRVWITALTEGLMKAARVYKMVK